MKKSLLLHSIVLLSVVSAFAFTYNHSTLALTTTNAAVISPLPDADTEGAAPTVPTTTSVAPTLVATKHDTQQVVAQATAPQTTPTEETSEETPAPQQTPGIPTRLKIPSINMNVRVISVGLNNKGEMAVPDGDTNDVGWYKNGTLPGDTGSAVFDAHVFAAFAPLAKLAVGSSIYVTTEQGATLHFIVEETKTYALKDVSADHLFNRTDAKRLNLITCAGQLTPDHSTYDHRLIVYAVLAED
ncbi:MAG: hypothetical protein JWO43_601 [Candidatus Adlerbacteria bacterium]|nr:hypothetical protein [Candidatus Adlerbacteria bacterium]